MAERRMFANSVIDSDAFLDMPLSAQALYFHLGMKADDDGFVGGPKKIQRMVAASEDDLRLLILKGFVIPFETGVCVITHWKLHNYIQKDRYRPTIYNVERDQLELAANKMYELCAQGVSKLDTGCSQDVSKLDAQVSVGKGRRGYFRGGQAAKEKPLYSSFSGRCTDILPGTRQQCGPSAVP